MALIPQSRHGSRSCATVRSGHAASHESAKVEGLTRVEIGDLLGMKDTAARAGVTTAHLRVLLARDQFPAPVKREPQLWLKRDIDAWKKTRQ